MSLWGDIQNLYYAISADIEHGECFYDKEMLDDFCSNLDKIKELSIEYFNKNKQEDEDE